MGVHKKVQPNWSSRFAGYKQHIYIYDVLFYYIDKTFVIVEFFVSKMFIIQGTVSVILSYPPCIKDNAWFTNLTLTDQIMWKIL